MMLAYRTATVDKIFYREAGDPNAPGLLLLHGFPTSSHMYRGLIPALADRYRVLAPDLPGFGFGFSDAPERSRFQYNFDHLAEMVERFTAYSTTAPRSNSDWPSAIVSGSPP